MDEPRPLYPEITPHRSGRQRLSDLRDLHFQKCGNPDGKRAVVLYAGPGGGISPFLRQGHVIRRAIGSSCSINAVAGNRPRTRVLNRTPHRIWSPKSRRYERTLASGHGRCLVAAGGATLAMAEASTRSDRVTELVLRGIFMTRKAEIDWFYQSGASQIFPDAFAKFAAPIPVAGRGDRLAAYHLRLAGPDGPENTEWARAWSRWEGTTISSLPDPDRAAIFSADHFAAAFAGIKCHYFRNGGVFAHDGWILREALAAISGVIIHGRQNVCTPWQNAWDLPQIWPEAELHVIADAGHTGTEPGIVDAKVGALPPTRARPASPPGYFQTEERLSL